MTLHYIRTTYGVPAKRGAKVRFTPDSRDTPMVGRIVGARAGLLRCRFEGSSRPWNCHPTWGIEYLNAQGKL